MQTFQRVWQGWRLGLALRCIELNTKPSFWTTNSVSAVPTRQHYILPAAATFSGPCGTRRCSRVHQIKDAFVCLCELPAVCCDLLAERPFVSL